jgi:transcriptional regulator with XRE-family HTH domain
MASGFVARQNNEFKNGMVYGFAMSNIQSLKARKSPMRLHFIIEWAEKRNLKQADIAREVGVDPGNVSRWYDGKLPKPEYLEKLAALFHTDVHGLFRHPDEDWVARLFRNKTDQEKRKALEMLKLLFEEQSKPAA